MKKTALPNTVNTQKYIPSPERFVADGAQLIGDIQLGKNSSIWYNAILRGDINRIEVGDGTNIQDGCIVHLENDLPCTVGNFVTVGHGAILHACTIEDNCLIGMGAIILNGAHIKKGSIIGAGAVVTENTVIPELSLAVGTPAKVIRELPESTIQTHQEWAEKYIALSKKHLNNPSVQN